MYALRKSLAILALFALASLPAVAQPATQPTLDEQKEAATAQSLYTAQNFVAALPLYEDLHKRQPASAVYTERLAMSLIGSSGGLSPAEQQAIRDRARKLLLEAQAAGDNSDLVQVLLEKTASPAGPTPTGPPSPGADALERAEKAFSSGDLPTALKGYQEAMAADPKMYEAPLFAGDAEYKLGHYKEADAWYAKAVAIDPDRETAYRYWGDCLMKQGDPTQAEGKYIDAIIADPYSRTPRIGLKEWADATGATMVPPPIQLPAHPTAAGKDKDGKEQFNINIDFSSVGKSGSSAALIYSINATLWQGMGTSNGVDKFHQAYPNEKQYRHSLAEEHDSIELALTSLKDKKIKPDKLDPTWKWLLDLDKDGMLDCWVLLDHPDQGIAQDYAAYRAAHRDLLHAYIAKYDVHGK